MPSIDVKKRRVDAKVIYYGPGRSGKTANLRYLAEHLDTGWKGKLTSLPTKADPDLHIDVIAVRMGEILGMNAVFHLCAGPGLASAVNTRRLLLRDTDGVVFVADINPRRKEANLDSFRELQENLSTHGIQIGTVPHVIQYNKCDLAEKTPIAELRGIVNPFGVPEFVASTQTGQGIVATLEAIVRSVSADLERRV